jgi:hypothetical protein
MLLRSRISDAKPLLWSLFAIVLAAGWAVVIFAPRLGLGEKYDFILYRWIGLSRGSSALALVWLAVIVLCSEGWPRLRAEI